MSSTNPSGIFIPYFIIVDIRNVLDITDTENDVELKDMGQIISGDITATLYRVSAEMPLQGDYLSMAQNACTFGTASLFKAKKGNKDLADFYNNLYRKNLDNLITSLQATRNTRTRRVSVSTDYKTQITYAQQRKF